MIDVENAPSYGDMGGSVTLAFRKNDPWYREHPLNVIAALATRGNMSHIECAIGMTPGSDGQQMSNVLRIYNDDVGVELCERTGRSPNYTYLQIGCSKAAEESILAFAKRQVGKPFNQWAMFRAGFWPRVTPCIHENGRNVEADNYFCAELVACALKTGGLMSIDSNPGAATPQSLYKMYRDHGATTGNPYVLRTLEKTKPLQPKVSIGRGFNTTQTFELVPSSLQSNVQFPQLYTTQHTASTNITGSNSLYTKPLDSTKRTPADAVIRNATRGLFQKR